MSACATRTVCVDAFLDSLTCPAVRRPSPPRCLLLVAHPDDEVVGAGGQLRWLRPGLHVAHLTPGVPIELDAGQRRTYPSLDAYGECRAGELQRVLAAVPIPHDNRHRLSGADQRCVQRLVPLTHELTALLRRVQPEILLTHAYEGGHPDHDSAALIAQAACAALSVSPIRVEFASYHLQEGRFASGSFLPGGSPSIAATIDSNALAFKRSLLATYTSQQSVLDQFDPELERFRVAPLYDFSRPPHDPPLYYERFPWGTDTRAFQRHAIDALNTLSPALEHTCH